MLHVIYSLGAGGAQRVIANYGRLLDRGKFDMSVCALTTGGHYEGEFGRSGVPYIVLGKREGLDLFISVKLFRLFRAQAVDVVHFHDMSASGWGTVPALLAGVKAIVSTEHNVVPDPGIMSAIKWRLVTLMLFFHRKIIAVSVEVSNARSHPFLSRKITTIRNGVDPSQFDVRVDRQQYVSELGLREKSVIVGIVARFEPQKAHDVFLQAMALVLAKRNDVSALLVGDGFGKADMVKLATDMGLRDRVVFAGVREDVPQILNLIDIFALSSDWEGLPMTILEAMACGKPVVSTDVGGVREAVVNGETGLLVPPRKPDLLAEAILRLVGDPDLRSAMGRKGRELLLQRFSAEAMTRATEKVYEEALASR